MINELDKQIHQKDLLIQNFEKELKSLSSKLEQISKEKELLTLELKEEQSLIKEKNEIIRKNHIYIQNLEKEIKHKENIILNYEKEVLQLKNELNIEKKQTNDLNLKLQNLTEENQNYLSNIKELQKDLENQQQELERLKIELENSLKREKNSKEIGNIIINSLLSMAEIADFSSRLDYIENVLFTEKPLRYSIFRIKNQNLLLYMSNLDLPTYFLELSQTIFGEVITDRKITTYVKEKNKEPYDLILNSNQIHYYNDDDIEVLNNIYKDSYKKEEFYIAMPIVSNNETNGLCIFVFNHDFKNKIQNQTLSILENLIPVLSTSFENDEFQKYNQQLNQFIKYYNELENIFLYKTNKAIEYINSYNKKENPANFFQKEDLLNFIYSEIIQIPQYMQKKWNNELIINFFNKIENVISYSEYIFKKPQQANYETLLNYFSKKQNYFFWIIFEFLVNAILHSEGKIFGIDIINNEKFFILKLYDDGEGILRKTGSYYPEKGNGIKLFQYSAPILQSKLNITKGPDGFGTSIEFYWDKFFINFNGNNEL
ncbi:MAG: hypothetical protein KatS3mg129_3278 [Leptospiraceae bacterium]|nr:MAG: hypothetical protein KatS3mg129_0699 [Leptospiraceae bacterium]GIX43545.1 MAG: hypothetical protein KatS3mg129_3278 [Leptospiraceae bacterium]